MSRRDASKIRGAFYFALATLLAEAITVYIMIDMSRSPGAGGVGLAIVLGFILIGGLAISFVLWLISFLKVRSMRKSRGNELLVVFTEFLLIIGLCGLIFGASWFFSAKVIWGIGMVVLFSLFLIAIRSFFRQFAVRDNPDPKSRSLEPKEIADRQAKGIPKEGGK